MQEYFDGKQLNDSVNPDEAVAYGATLQAAILKGEAEDDCDIVLLDVNPLSLGIETKGGINSVLIEKNTTLPTQNEREYKTSHDNQTRCQITIFEGERKLVQDNHKLGEFELVGIEAKPKGEAKIGVSFNIDTNGILNVTAYDKENHANSENIKIEHDKSRLSAGEIDKLVEEARKYEFID